MIATVTAGASSTALWGNVSFENGGAAIAGCANLAVAPSGQSATVACSTSFPASSAQLSAVFTPTTGSILKGSSGAAGTLKVGRDSSSTSLTPRLRSPLATLRPTRPRSRHRPHVRGLWSRRARSSSWTMVNRSARAPASRSRAGKPPVRSAMPRRARTRSALSTPAMPTSSDRARRRIRSSATPIPTAVLGTITSTMQWQFYYTPRYTIVRALVVTGVSRGGDRGREMPRARVPVREPHNGPAHRQEVRAEGRQHVLHGRQLQRHPRLRGKAAEGRRPHHRQHRPSATGSARPTDSSSARGEARRSRSAASPPTGRVRPSAVSAGT